MPLALQAKILRLLQEQSFERVGGNETIQTDVRLIAATHRDLKAWSAEGKFRPDLYYRLGVFTIHLPPLRERGDDLPLLVQHFCGASAASWGGRFATSPRRRWSACATTPGPGNIRELQSVLKQALLHASGTDPAPGRPAGAVASRWWASAAVPFRRRRLRSGGLRRPLPVCATKATNTPRRTPVGPCSARSRSGSCRLGPTPHRRLGISRVPGTKAARTGAAPKPPREGEDERANAHTPHVAGRYRMGTHSTGLVGDPREPTEAAKILGIGEATLYRRLHKVKRSKYLIYFAPSIACEE